MAENRRHTANYVEARAVLMPAVDFFGRAVQNAQDQHRLTGELLALVSYLLPLYPQGSLSCCRKKATNIKRSVLAC